MKKIYILLLLIVELVHAQPPNGSVAPLFTVNDINGNTHSLANYLAEGKTIIIDFSTTWCPPCWDYHKTHALESVYKTYGPQGTNQVVVLLVEVDPSTGLNELLGIGNDTAGNYVEGTSYPIIDSGLLGNMYLINQIPTIVKICPNGLLYNIGALSPQGIVNSINSNCTTLDSLENYVLLDAQTIESCEQNNTPTVNLKNLGTNPITSAVIELKENGTLVETKNFTGNITQYNSASVNFNAINMYPTSNYTFNILSVNTTTPHPNSILSDNFSFNLVPQLTSPNLEIHVYTDDDPEAIAWAIQGTSQGDFSEIIASGGLYDINGNAYTNDADANTVKIHYVTVPNVSECYQIIFADEYNGWNSNTQYHGIKIYANGTLINDIPVGNFGQMHIRKAFNYQQSLAVEEFENKKISVYPNPTNGLININYPEMVTAKVYNIVGKLLIQQEKATTVDISHLENGIYMINLINENINRTLKIIKK